MSAWHRGPILAFDTETDSPDPTVAHIVTATVLVIGETPGHIRQRSWLLAQDVTIPDGAIAVHGITTEQMRAEGTDVAQGLTDITAALVEGWRNGWPIVAYNAPFDLTLLDHELARHNLPSLAQVGGPGLVIDPLVCDRRLDRYRKGKRTLTAACEHYSVRLDGAHDATADAIAAARLAWRLAEAYPAVMQERGLVQLQADQARWHAEWAEHLTGYWHGQGKSDVVDGTWPYRVAARRQEKAA